MIWEFIFRLALAGALGILIGLEREYRSKEAGYRTHFLVCLGSALIMIVSQYGFETILLQNNVSLDPSRVAAQVVSGIGFIGAGTIIIQKRFVRGLTTAAGLWATAGIGLAVGSGLYWLGIAATILTLIGLEALSYIFGGLGGRSTLLKFYTGNKSLLPEVVQEIRSKGYKISNYEMYEERDAGHTTYHVTIVVKTLKKIEENNLFTYLEKFPEIMLEKME